VRAPMVMGEKRLAGFWAGMCRSWMLRAGWRVQGTESRETVNGDQGTGIREQ
jgi:hypothetical protein